MLQKKNPAIETKNAQFIMPLKGNLRKATKIPLQPWNTVVKSDM